MAVFYTCPSCHHSL
ncbi:MAG: hypothetical protein ACOYMS_14810 [Terrimicrobiaceae bacterium]